MGTVQHVLQNVYYTHAPNTDVRIITSISEVQHAVSLVLVLSRNIHFTALQEQSYSKIVITCLKDAWVRCKALMALKGKSGMARRKRGQSVLRGGESVMVGSREETVVMRPTGASDGVE